MANLKKKLEIPTPFYACVEHYSSGRVAFWYVTQELPPPEMTCAGAYDTAWEAEQSAKTLRDLLRKGEVARSNAEYWKNKLRLFPDMFAKGE